MAEGVVFNEVEFTYFRLGELDSCIVFAWKQIGGDAEASVGFGGTDKVEHGFHIGERLASPVPGDLAKQAVLDRVPLGSAGWVMAHGDGETERIADPVLKSLLPGVTTPAVAAAPIGQEQEFLSLRVSMPSFV